MKILRNDMLSIYNMINPNYGAANDFFRCLLMYKKRVYLDIKVQLG